MGLTRIFDGLYVDQMFQKNERGEVIFYPSGLMGHGYLLPAEREAAMRQSMRRLMAFSLAGGIGFAIVAMRFLSASFDPLTVLASGGAFVVLLGLITILQRRLAHNLKPVAERVSVREWLRRGRQARQPWTYGASVILGLLTLLLAGAGFALGLWEGDPLTIAGGLFLLAVGTLLTWDGVMGLIERSHAPKAQ